MSTRTVLIVEDDVVLRTATERVLRREGYTVDTAGNSNEAHTHAACQTYAVIAVDYELPGVNGLELIASLRKSQPHAIYVLVSGAHYLGEPDSLAERGVDCVLRKPWSVEEFMGLIRRSVANKAVAHKAAG